jgi:hypothetical protein
MPRPTAWADAARHPIAWFSALLRGIDRDDHSLIDRALCELAALGFRVELAQPRETPHEAEGQGVGR